MEYYYFHFRQTSPGLRRSFLKITEQIFSCDRLGRLYRTHLYNGFGSRHIRLNDSQRLRAFHHPGHGFRS
jgi:lysozyme family protein